MSTVPTKYLQVVVGGLSAGFFAYLSIVPAQPKLSGQTPCYENNSSLSQLSDCLSLNSSEAAEKRISSTVKSNPLSELEANPFEIIPSEPLSPLDAITQNASFAHGIDANLLKAIIKVESGSRSDAISSKGAAGLMQITAETARKLGIKDRFDPSQNIHGGAKYLRVLMNLYKNNLTLTLAAYNAGPGAVQKHGGIPPYKETRMYVDKVMVAYKAFSAASRV